MRATSLILTICTGLLGLALIVYGVWDGLWPPTVQFLAGLALTLYAGLRLRYRR